MVSPLPASPTGSHRARVPGSPGKLQDKSRDSHVSFSTMASANLVSGFTQMRSKGGRAHVHRIISSAMGLATKHVQPRRTTMGSRGKRLQLMAPQVRLMSANWNQSIEKRL